MNLNWGFGYVGGGDIKNSLNNGNAANQSIAYLSIADAKGVNNGGGNWSTVMSYNGIWPTAAGAGIHGNSGTNDYSPITLGYYPLWGFEVLVHPENTSASGSTISGQNITYGQLGDQTYARQLHGRVQCPKLQQRRRGHWSAASKMKSS